MLVGSQKSKWDVLRHLISYLSCNQFWLNHFTKDHHVDDYITKLTPKNIDAQEVCVERVKDLKGSTCHTYYTTTSSWVLTFVSWNLELGIIFFWATTTIFSFFFFVSD
jgi:hypothetical protein